MGAIKTIPFQGGCNTAVEPALITPGGYSLIQNMRSKHPGFETRKGQIALHTTADGTNQVKSLYGFSKGRRSEDHLFAQMGDSDVLKATALPPAITTGVFGAQVLDGAANPTPAAWSNLNDFLLFSNGVDDHKIWSGSLTYVKRFMVYESASAMTDPPLIGKDFTDQVTDGVDSTVAVLGALETNAGDEIAICCHVNPCGLKFKIGTPNANASTPYIFYWKGSWLDVPITDGTAVAGKPLAQDGTITWVLPPDARPSYLYGICGYWLGMHFSHPLSAGTTVAGVEYVSELQSVKNIWNGIMLDVVEAQVYLNASTAWRTYGGAAIAIAGLTASDAVYFATADPVEAIHIDVGQIPNTTASTTINALQFWNGTAWQSVGTFVDGTSGLSKSGWIVFPNYRALSTTDQPSQPLNLNNSNIYMHWYKFTVDKTLSANMVIWIQYRPYFLISQLGKGVCNAAWKGRAVYSFDRWPDYLYISAQADAQVLNGDDYGIIQVGDGRSHKVTAMLKFHNELLVWQEEKGETGGCLTLIEGYSPTTYGKLILSSRLGAMSAKCVAVIDGVLTSTATEETVKTLAFALSRFGVYVTDGRTCSLISDEIRNYFDPNESVCIRRGYESEMWLAYDSAYNVIRVGLVSGSSATVANVFPVFDLIEKTWSFDTLGQALSCQIDIGAASGNVPVVQVAGGTADGTVYRVNTGAIDVATAIPSLVRMEIDGLGAIINLREMVLRIKVQSAGSLTFITVENSIVQATKTLAMTAEVASQTIRRHRFNLNAKGQHITLAISLSTASQVLYLLDYAPLLLTYEDQ